MYKQILRRLLLFIMTLVITSIIIFVLTRLLPGDVAKLILGREASDVAIKNFNAEFGLDQPVVVQYFRWVGDFISFNWGKSYTAGNPEVLPLVLARLWNSLKLGFFALIIALPLSLILGTLSALWAGGTRDSLISIFSLSFVGIPEFISGILLIQFFALGTRWFPAVSFVSGSEGFFQWLRLLFLPALTASLVLIGYLIRMTRAGVLEELKKPYVRTARLKGISQARLLFVHVFPNAMLPTITVLAMSIGWLIGGLVVIENVFNYPGLGSLLVTAVNQKNLPVLQSVSMIMVIIFSISNLAADLSYSLLDPRLRKAA
jgi:peptide/nickel transport system permease protein